MTSPTRQIRETADAISAITAQRMETAFVGRRIDRISTQDLQESFRVVTAADLIFAVRRFRGPTHGSMHQRITR
jgi:hypothetical protein